ncbi:MAG: hypothetical protein L3J06_02700 [Cyclobacteriaceae bacterium]|nr:hypothetical protein [Cyclobacteriaceae bacterium]
MNYNIFFYFLIIILGLVNYLLQNIILSDNVIFDHFGEQLSYERIEQMLNIQNKWAWVNYVLLPVLYLIKFSLLSMWILSGTILFGYKNTFKEIFQVVMVSDGYYGLNCATYIGLIVPVITVQTVPLS